ncbi:hypothetical protein ACIO8F_09825 [Streptomyces sp. NPDC087228]|uniref:hypothetical protein n=1 Tax=Streptomyces sp. NPDC087228 TaxID=3365772 RepID=UPI00381E091F
MPRRSSGRWLADTVVAHGALPVGTALLEDSPSTYMTLDLTVWRNAAGSGSGSRARHRAPVPPLLLLRTAITGTGGAYPGAVVLSTQERPPEEGRRHRHFF